MSHMLRVAVTVTSLITCPACATTTALSSPASEAGTETIETMDAAAPGACGYECQAAAPASKPAAPRWWQNPFRATPADGSAPLLTWEETRAAARHYSALMFEPTDSRMRIVLNMPDATPPTATSAGATPAAPASASPVSQWLSSAAFWPGVSDGAGEVIATPEPVDVDLQRTVLSGFNDGVVELLGAPPPDVHHTPEPGTLVLTALGLFGVGVARRVRRT
jgi:PEP-CTERM motif